MSFDLKKTGLYKSFVADSEEPDILITFAAEVAKVISLSDIERFYSRGGGVPYKGFRYWNEDHFAFILKNPKVLSNLAFLNIENLQSLVIAYGLWCEANGHKLEYFDENEKPLLGGEIKEMIESRKCPDTEKIDTCISRGATISALKRLLRLDVIPCRNKNRNTDRSMLRQMFDCECHRGPYCTCPMNCAAYYGQLEIINYFRDFGVRWDEDTIAMAAINNNLDLVKYLLAEGCPVDGSILYRMVAGDIKDLKVETAEYIMNIDRRPTDYFLNHIINETIKQNNVEVTRYLLSNGVKPVEMYMDIVFPTKLQKIENMFEMIKLLHEFNFAWNAYGKRDFLTTIMNYYRNEALTSDQIIAICEMGCHTSQVALFIAIESYDLNLIKYLQERCMWDSFGAFRAVLNRSDSHDRVEILIYLGNFIGLNLDNYMSRTLQDVNPRYIVELLEDFHDAGFDWDTNRLYEILVKIINNRDYYIPNGKKIDSDVSRQRYQYSLDMDKYIEDIMKFSNNRTHGPRTLRTEKIFTMTWDQ